MQYSPYVLWQACRRVWRLGQTRPVKAFYLAYEGTLEEKAYALIGQKIKAAQLLYGDEVSSALVEDAGDASLVMALVEAIKEGDAGLQIGRGAQLFGDTEHVVTESVVGSPVIRSMSVFEKWMLERGLTYEDVRPTHKRKGRTPPPGKMRLDLFAGG